MSEVIQLEAEIMNETRCEEPFLFDALFKSLKFVNFVELTEKYLGPEGTRLKISAMDGKIVIERLYGCSEEPDRSWLNDHAWWECEDNE